MLETSTTTEKLDAALAKAQGEIKPALKEKQNSHFKSSYADLAAVWDAARAAISKSGVSVTQWPIESADGRLRIVTRLACQGEWLRATFSIPVGKLDAHGYGSAVTYARRFTLMAALGIAPDDDDDGNGAANVTHDCAAQVQSKIASKAPAKAIKPAPVEAKPVALEQTREDDPESFIPSYGLLTGVALRERSTAELRAWYEKMNSALAAKGKSLKDQSPEAQATARAVDCVLLKRAAAQGGEVNE